MAGERSPGGAILYWVGAVAMIAVGLAGAFTIGVPFLLTGVVMLIVGAGGWRHRPEILWPPLVGVWVFVLVFVLVAPLGCTTSGSGSAPALSGGSPSTIQIGHTVCTNALGINYSGTGVYNPPLMPAFLAGLAAGLAVAVATRALLVRGRRRRAAPRRPDLSPAE